MEKRKRRSCARWVVERGCKQWRRDEEERRRIGDLDFDWVKEAKLGE